MRRVRLDALAGLFVSLLRLCQKARLGSLGDVEQDGVKDQASDSPSGADERADVANTGKPEKLIAGAAGVWEAVAGLMIHRGARASGPREGEIR